jgi:hypothetical protein
MGRSYFEVGKRFTCALVCWVLAGLGVGATHVEAVARTDAGSRPGAFCAQTQVRDLASPMNALPPVHHLSASGQLPFGPANLEVLPSSPTKVVVGGGRVGLVLAASRPVRLEWKISGSLSQIDRKGRQVGPSRKKVLRVGVVGRSGDAAASVFRVGPRPSLYRVDFEFRDDSGRWLGHYAEYFRVVRREVKAILRLSAETYQPGSVLRARLENRGTRSLYYGFDLVVERWTGTEWVQDSSTPRSWPLEGLSLGGGMVGDCEVIVLGRSPGEYRLVKEASASPTGPEWPVRAYFRIVP